MSDSDTSEDSVALARREERAERMRKMTLATSVRGQLAAGEAPADTAGEEEEKCIMLQVPPGAMALRDSSLFLFSGKNPIRVFCYNMIRHKAFETVIILLILSNCVFLALDDPTVGEDDKPDWHFTVEVFYTTAFTIEMVLKVFSLGLVMHKGAYWRDSWNNLDFIIVVFSYLNFIPGMANVSALRTLRVLRPLRSMNAVKGLKILVVGLLKSFGGLVHVLFLAGFIFCIFGILGVQLWMGLFRNRCQEIATGKVLEDYYCADHAQDNIYWGRKCPDGHDCIKWKNPHFGFLNFDNVGTAFLAIFQICTFEGWTEILVIVFDVYGMITFPYFFFIIMIGAYFVPNLVLAVINDKFIQAQKEHEEQERQRLDDLEVEKRLRRNQQLNLRDIRFQQGGGSMSMSGSPRGTPQAGVTPQTGTTPRSVTPQGGALSPSHSGAFLEIDGEGALSVSVENSSADDEEMVTMHEDSSSSPQVKRQSLALTEQSALLLSNPGDIAAQAAEAEEDRQPLNPDGQTPADSLEATTTLEDTDTAPEPNFESKPKKSVAFAIEEESSSPHAPLTRNPSSSGVRRDEIITFTPGGQLRRQSSGAALSQDDLGGSGRRPSHRVRSPTEEFLIVDPSKYDDIRMPTAFDHTAPPTREGSSILRMNKSSRQPSMVGLLPNGQTVLVDVDEMNSFGHLHVSAEGDPDETRSVDEMDLKDKVLYYIEHLRGAIHEMTEGYPRIISLFLYEQKKIQKRLHEGLEEDHHSSSNKHRGKAAELMKRTEADKDIAGLPMSAVEAAEAMQEGATTTAFTKFIVLCIVLNTVALASSHHNEPDWLTTTLQITNYVLTGIFGIEMVLKLLALGIELYVDDPFNTLDGTVVIISFIELGLSGSSTVSVLRALRLLRVLKLLKNFPSLRHIIRVTLAALSDTAYLNVIMLLYLFIAALMGMQFFGGKFEGVKKELAEEGEDLRAHFDNFVYAFFSVFQVLTRDGWVNIMWNAMRATTPAAVLYFIGCVLMGDFIILSLFLAILISAFGEEDTDVDSSTEASLMGQAFDFNASVAMSPHNRRNALNNVDDEKVPVMADSVFKLNGKMMAELNHALSVREGGQQQEREQRKSVVSCWTTKFARRRTTMFRGDDPFGESPPMVNKDTEWTSVECMHQQSMTSAGGQTSSADSHHSALAAIEPAENTAIVGFVDDGKRITPTNSPSAASLQAVNQEPIICDLCGDIMQEPLPQPPLIKQRTREALHKQHCPFMSLRAAKERILDSIRTFVEKQTEEGIQPTQTQIETVLGQAWSCGLLLNVDSELALELDPETDERTWEIVWDALEEEQAILDLRVGEEQVGRSLQAYAQANIPKEHRTNGGYALFIFGPRNPFRIFVSSVVANPWFDRIVLLLIMLSSVAMILDNPLEDQNSEKYVVLTILDRFFTCCFIIEMLLKWIAKGVAFIDGAYFRDPWNYLDASIVLISILSWALSGINIGFLKALRTFRALRPLRVINRNRGLKMVVRTLLQSIQGISNVALLSSLNYLIFGILGVQFFAGKLYSCTDASITQRLECTGSYIPEVNMTDPNAVITVENGTAFTFSNASNATVNSLMVDRRWRRFDRNFDHIGVSVLTMFEVSSGEWWMDVLWSGVDAYSVNHAPVKDHRPYMGFFFIVFYIISNFFLLNLFVGVVIYNFNSVKSRMDGLSLLTDEQKMWVSTQRLMLNFRPVPLMKPAEDKLGLWCHRVVKTMAFELGVAVAILANIVFIGVDHYNMPMWLDEFLRISNYVFVAIFIVEAMFKIAAYRLRYFTSGWNQFDFFLVLLSIAGLILESLQGSGLPIDVGILRVFRIFRIMRILRLVKSARKVRILLETLWYSLPSLGNIGSFMLLVYFIFAILGIQLFAKVQEGETLDHRYTNFRSIENALILLFRFTTVEDWNAVMHDLMVSEPECQGEQCGTPFAPLYFVFFMLMTSFVITNLFIAIILDNFETTMRIDQSEVKMSDLHRFIEIWSEYDPDATMMMPTHRFPHLMAKLQPPLGISRSEGRLEIIQRTTNYRIPEHGGYVHFVEVLIPLARHTLHVNLTERNIREHEEMWRGTFPTLQSLPVLRYRQKPATIDMYFCSTYIASAFRRRVAMIFADEIRAARHREMLVFCRENNIDHRRYSGHLKQMPTTHISQALRNLLTSMSGQFNQTIHTGSRRTSLVRGTPTTPRNPHRAASPSPTWNRSKPKMLLAKDEESEADGESDGEGLAMSRSFRGADGTPNWGVPMPQRYQSEVGRVTSLAQLTSPAKNKSRQQIDAQMAAIAALHDGPGSPSPPFGNPLAAPMDSRGFIPTDYEEPSLDAAEVDSVGDDDGVSPLSDLPASSGQNGSATVPQYK